MRDHYRSEHPLGKHIKDSTALPTPRHRYTPLEEQCLCLRYRISTACAHGCQSSSVESGD